MNESVIIIGGGLGGLFTGAFLAKNGCKVTVLEKNAVIGGGLQCFKRGNEIFETGMHVLGGLRKGGSIYKICEYLGIIDKLELLNVDDDCIDTITYLSDGKTYKIGATPKGFVDSLSKEFPHEKENLENYIAEIYRLADEVDLFYLRKSGSNITMHSEHFMWAADKLIAYYISDPKLQDILGYLNPLYGGVANHTPAYIHALINVLYINGPTRFVNGSQQLADLLAQIISDNSGAVLTNKCVSEISVSDKNITEVTTSDGIKYTAQRYISAVHPCELLSIIEPQAFPKSYRNRLAEIPNSYSSFTVFLTLKENTFKYINHTCYFQNDYGMVWLHNEYDNNTWPRGFMYMTPPDRNQGTYARRMLINCIMEYKQVERWNNTTVGNRGEEYNKWKQEQVDKIIAKMEVLYPHFCDCIEHIYAASPLTIRDYYHTKEGAIFGYRKDCQHIELSQVPIYTKIHNLLLTGQNINLHGICGVPLTAISTAEAILGNGYLLDKINNVNNEE